MNDNKNGDRRDGEVKIHIIGAPGSGKTYLAERLSGQCGIVHHDLDDLQWDNSADAYGVKRNIQERDRLLADILKSDSWIIEGVYYRWCSRCFEEADLIYLLCVSAREYRYRIIRRFVRRKLGLEVGKKETVASLHNLLKWAEKYRRQDMVEIRKMLAPYSHKVIERRG